MYQMIYRISINLYRYEYHIEKIDRYPALLITAEKKVTFCLSYFFRVSFLVRHIFSESGLFDLNDHFGNLVRQIRHIKHAKRHFDLSFIPLFSNVASISVV